MESPHNDNDLHLGQIDANAVLRDLMDVAKVALGPQMPQLREGEALSLLGTLLEIIDARMPDELQRQDKRVLAARAVCDLSQGQ